MADPKPGNTDRGWNDPPMFSFGGANPPPPSTQGPPRRTLLNKRVAFPLSGPTNTPVPPLNSGDGSLLPPPHSNPALASVQILPPALDTTTPLPVPLVVPNMVPASPPVSPTLEADNLVESLDKCRERLNCASDNEFLSLVESHLDNLLTSCKHCLKERASEEIQRKIALFREYWEQGKLSDAVKVKMSYLAIALSRNRFDVAHDIHLGLMVDYTAEVNHWMVGIKRLIQEGKAKADSMNKDVGSPGKRSGEQDNTSSQPEKPLDKKPKLEDSITNS